MVRFLTRLFRILTVLALLAVIVINASSLIEIGEFPAHLLTYLLCFFLEAAMFCQTVENRERNSSPVNYGFKLLFVLILFLSSTVVFLTAVLA